MGRRYKSKDWIGLKPSSGPGSEFDSQACPISPGWVRRSRLRTWQVDNDKSLLTKKDEGFLNAARQCTMFVYPALAEHTPTSGSTKSPAGVTNSLLFLSWNTVIISETRVFTETDF